MSKISILDKFWLWRNNYCIKHLTRKKSLEGWGWVCDAPYCLECDKEEDRAHEDRERAVEKKAQFLREKV